MYLRLDAFLYPLLIIITLHYCLFPDSQTNRMKKIVSPSKSVCSLNVS